MFFFWMTQDTVHLSLVFRWIFIPFLKKELDAWADRINNSRKCANCNKILPHGVPNDIYSYPHRYGALDFKVSARIYRILTDCSKFNIYMSCRFTSNRHQSTTCGRNLHRRKIQFSFLFLLSLKNMLKFFMRAWEAQW